ncbi:hypothetical protein ZYGR_0N05680 [Zygosaccharomyces rouxii]|uniref:Major facilitator superfamily (MFS) profile domain-containing protein n=1 Tax=Zygosaccharomyces rouxii TaxID=4956 RepID=A0A1Q3A0G2_ZYGRO|nr:hypothetical protein ZYGR_0N05680 [Zygosaccharomyces rouxii]
MVFYAYAWKPRCRAAEAQLIKFLENFPQKHLGAYLYINASNERIISFSYGELLTTPNTMSDCSTIYRTPTNRSRDETIEYSSNYSHFSQKLTPEKSEHLEIDSIPSTEKGSVTNHWSIICSCLMIAFGGFVFGWDTGTISGFINMTDFKRRFGHWDSTNEEFQLSEARMGLIVSVFNVGCAIGGFTLGRLGDIYGRREGLMCSVLVYVVGIVVQIASINTWYQYFFGRILSGLGVGSLSVLSPTLISEISPKQLRGTCVSFYQLMITLGIFLGYCTDYGTKFYANSVQWRVPLGLCFLWAIFMLVGLMVVPESPRFLLEKGFKEEAIQSVSRLNKLPQDHPTVIEELESINAAIEVGRLEGEASWKELFSNRGQIFRRVKIGAMILSLQQLTGNNYFFYYGTTIFRTIGLDDSFETSIILGVINLVSTFVALWTVDRFGRRKSLLTGSLAMSACFLIFASVGVTKLWPHGRDEPSSKPAGNAMVAFACLFIFSFATTWAPTAYVIVSETYPLRVKNRAMAIAVGCDKMWGFLIGFLTPFITSSIHFYYGYVFLGCLIFSFFYVFFFVCETKGLTLEEVNEMYEEGTKAWHSSNWTPQSQRLDFVDEYALYKNSDFI